MGRDVVFGTVDEEGEASLGVLGEGCEGREGGWEIMATKRHEESDSVDPRYNECFRVQIAETWVDLNERLRIGFLALWWLL